MSVSVSYWATILGNKKLTLLGKGDIAEVCESGSMLDIALMVEVIVDGGMDGNEFLQAALLSKSKHGSLSSPER